MTREVYSAASIANAFLQRAKAGGHIISPMKIQKLVYIAHGYGLVERDAPMLNEVFQAWRFGPVLDSLYHECKVFRKQHIDTMLRDIDPITGVISEAPPPPANDTETNDIIDYVWDNYKNFSAIQLSNWTHDREAPWSQVTDNGQKILRNQNVPNDVIKQYFKEHMYVDSAPEESSCGGGA